MSERLTAQCPHCQSVFQLGNKPLETAGGKVRCGKCLDPFLVEITQSSGELVDTDEGLLPDIEPGSLTDSEWATGIIVNPLEEQTNSKTTQASTRAIVALLLLLPAIQLLWFNSCSYYGAADLHNWIKWLPTPLGCDSAQEIDHSYLGLHHSRVASQQNTTDILGIDTLLSNRASYKINYPALSLAFFSYRGSTVAQRIFCPIEYLAGDALGQSDIPPGSEVHLAFSIVDPGLLANRYQLSISENSCHNK